MLRYPRPVLSRPVRSKPVLPILALVVTLAAASCTGSKAPAKSVSASPSASLLPSPATGKVPPVTTAGRAKPVLKGLLDRDGAPPAAYLGSAIAGWVVNTTWRAVQPTKDGPLAADNPIDRALVEVRAYNAAHPTAPVGLRLRVRAGVDAPDWAKSLGGPPISLIEPQGGGTGTVGRFWTADFGRSYAGLQAKLAAEYDGVAEIRETVISRCTLFYAEPFVRPKGDQGDIAALAAAGFSTAADHRCLQEQIDAHSVWRTTNSDLSLNPYQDLERRGGPATGGGADEAFTDAMMAHCRSVLGNRCVLANNSLRSPPKYAAMYAKMKAFGPPLAFQTAAAKRIGSLAATLQYADQFGADSVELPVSYRQQPAADVVPFNAALRKK